MLKRFLDILVVCLLAPIWLPVLTSAMLLVRLSSRGPAVHWSRRAGRDDKMFAMPKLRTMRVDTPEVASHLLPDPSRWLTPVGRFLRASSIDELPQLVCVLAGQMSLVGPRPALFNQDDLISLRKVRGVSRLRPGVTGWAQINGRDMISTSQKVSFDEWYLHHQSVALDLRILFLTIWNALRRTNISH